MRISTIFNIYGLFNIKSLAFDIITPFYPFRIIDPQIINCNSVFIYADVPKILSPSDENKELFQEQTQYLTKLFNSQSFQFNLQNHKGFVGFKGQNQFLADLKLPSSIFMGRNERLIRRLIGNQNLSIPEFDLDFLAIETMLNSLMIVMVFDISHLNDEKKFFFRQGYHHESVKYANVNYSLNNLPIMAIDEKVIGSPFLSQQALPMSKNTKKVLISIFQMGKKTFDDQKNFNIVANQFINQAQQRCQIKVSKATFFKGLPIIDNVQSNRDNFKIFVDSKTPEDVEGSQPRLV